MWILPGDDIGRYQRLRILRLYELLRVVQFPAMQTRVRSRGMFLIKAQPGSV